MHRLESDCGLSWGTKDLNTVAQPSDEATKEIVRRRFLRFRTLVVGVSVGNYSLQRSYSLIPVFKLWLLSNIILIFLVFYFNIASQFLLVTILSVLCNYISRLGK